MKNSLNKMVKQLVVLAAGVLLVTASNAGVHGDQFEFESYMRTGTGVGSAGGRQICFYNGAPTNEFRLGNECDHIYGELGFTANLLKGKSSSDPYYKSHVTLALSAPGQKVWESSDPTLGGGSNQNVAMTEAYLEAGNVDGLPFKLWAGKRYYRFQDVHMYDWYYWGSLGGGNGAGLGDISAGPGRLSVALLYQAPDMRRIENMGRDDAANTNSERIDTYSTPLGQPQMRVMDVKYEGVSIGGLGDLNFWVALASSPATTLTVTNGNTAASSVHDIEAGTGAVYGVRLHTGLDGGFNDLALINATGLLKDFNIYQDIFLEKDNNTVMKASRMRLVDHITLQPSAQWAFHGVFAYDSYNTGADADNKGTWTSIGFRPVWYMTDHYHLLFEVGQSTVSEAWVKDANGNILSRQLTRFTIAPELAASKSIWGRPTMRLFYTQSMWNEANKGRVGGSEFADKTAGSAYGFQGEVWF